MTSAQGKTAGEQPQGTAVLSDGLRPEDVSLWQLMRGAWVTRGVLLASLAFSIVFWNCADPASRDSLRSFGVLHRSDLWLGNCWSLTTSAFLHANWLHWALNAYWLVVLGGAVERFFGTRRFVGFVFLSILVSSCAQVAASAVTGIGLSGLVYALFGFVWIGRSRVNELRRVLSRGQLTFALVWILGGVAVTETGVLAIGNAAHVGGLVIGLLAAWRHFGARPKLARWSMGLTTFGVVVASFFCPWSSEWWLAKSARLASAADWEGAHDLAHRAARLSPADPNPLRYCGWAAHHLGAYAEAVADFDAAIALVPDAYSFRSRAEARAALGQHTEAEADYGRAIEVSPADANLYVSRCAERAQVGRLADGLADCDRAVSLDPRNTEAAPLRARLLARLRANDGRP
jgi:GlpG protein